MGTIYTIETEAELREFFRIIDVLGVDASDFLDEYPAIEREDTSAITR